MQTTVVRQNRHQTQQQQRTPQRWYFAGSRFSQCEHTHETIRTAATCAKDAMQRQQGLRWSVWEAFITADGRMLRKELHIDRVVMARDREVAKKRARVAARVAEMKRAKEESNRRAGKIEIERLESRDARREK